MPVLVKVSELIVKLWSTVLVVGIEVVPVPPVLLKTTVSPLGEPTAFQLLLSDQLRSVAWLAPLHVIEACAGRRRQKANQGNRPRN